MRKLLIFLLIIIFPVLCNADFETPVKKADVILGYNPTYPVPSLGNLLKLCWNWYYRALVFEHGVVVTDEDGTVRSSVQGKGVSNSSVDSLFEQFEVLCLIRNNKLNDIQRDEIVERALSLEGDYDKGGYWGTFLDIFFLIGRSDFFVIFMENPKQYYCTEVASISCNLGIRYPSPLDIYWYADDLNTDWEIIEIKEKG